MRLLVGIRFLPMRIYHFLLPGSRHAYPGTAVSCKRPPPDSRIPDVSRTQDGGTEPLIAKAARDPSSFLLGMTEILTPFCHFEPMRLPFCHFEPVRTPVRNPVDMQMLTRRSETCTGSLAVLGMTEILTPFCHFEPMRLPLLSFRTGAHTGEKSRAGLRFPPFPHPKRRGTRVVASCASIRSDRRRQSSVAPLLLLLKSRLLL